MTDRRASAGVLLTVLVGLICCASAAPLQQTVAAPGARFPLPNKKDTFKFAVIGDNGNGEQGEYQVGTQMAAWRDRFPFNIVVMMGDNIYGSDRPQDYENKFRKPYQALLDKGVKFYASLGNHDSREQSHYEYFNMNGKLYYSFKPARDVHFFVLESTYFDPDQQKWIENELKASGSKWKIAYFHHPLYSSAKTHGSTLKLREVLEPLFIRSGVTLVLNGHDHTYERIWPQNGIQYFVVGSGGQLRKGDLRKGSPLTAFGNDTDNVFMLMEIDGDNLTFNAITGTGRIIDSGVIARRK